MKTILATALILASGFASAHSLNVNEVADLPVHEVATIESVAGEGKTEFVKRVAETLEGFTAETGFEACGWIAYGGNSPFAVKVVTINSQIACGMSKAEVPEGYVAGSETIHSHPQGRMLRLSNVDMKVLGNPAGMNRREANDPCKFSNQDYTAPGYLVTCGKVLHQRGRGTEKEI